MGAFFSLVYGLVAYALFLATFLYAIAFRGQSLRAEVDRHGRAGRPSRRR